MRLSLYILKTYLKFLYKKCEYKKARNYFFKDVQCVCRWLSNDNPFLAKCDLAYSVVDGSKASAIRSFKSSTLKT